MAQHTDTHAAHGGEHHVLPLSIYWGVFFALVIGTALTVWTATIDLGRMNVIVALVIASVKAILVILFFMHVKYSSRMVWLFAGAGFFWVLLMIAFTMQDFATRSW
jgi:cytochrome c oxidase subunit IV